MKIKILFIVLFVFSFKSIIAQSSNEVSFSASEIQQMALKYSGSALNWPVLIKLADHNIEENIFSLTRSDLLQLKSLSKTSTVVDEQQIRIKKLISSGATIFAKEELRQATALISGYSSSIRNGELEKALLYGLNIPIAVDKLESVLMMSRMVNVQAQLEKKEGNVDKRLGLLASWENAAEGDLFKEADGLKTHEKSFASLAFTDGSSVFIDPNTVAIIRKSRIDKLDESLDTEISLVEGGLLAKISAIGKERNTYILNAGSSSSELNTQNFYAESDGDRIVKLTNYDGEATVKANSVSVSVKKNEGTIVEKGKAPLQPVTLLPAPHFLWANKDTLIYSDNVVLAYQEVDEAVSYHIQYSDSHNFDSKIKDQTVNRNVVNLKDLDIGTTYVRIQSIDKLGLRGPYSDPLRITRNIDNQPPPIFVDELNGNIIFTLTNSFSISGVTEPDVKLTIDDGPVVLQASGKFSSYLTNLDIEQKIRLKAVDKSGNVTEKEIKIIKLTDEQLFDIKLTGAAGQDVLVVQKETVTMTSKAYPGLEIVIYNGMEEKVIQTDSKGRWGATLSMQKGNLSITFRDIKSKKVYLSKSYIVQAN